MAHPIAGKNYIEGQWHAGKGETLLSTSPVDESIVWNGSRADLEQADAAVSAARTAFSSWAKLDLNQRMEFAKRFANHVQENKTHLAELITRETGKPLWESFSEVATVIGKVDNSIKAITTRRWTTTETAGDPSSIIRYKPHGVLIVLGPFNLPAHLPGAHIVPALLAGNTVVFKPSEQTPAVGQWLTEAWQAAGLPMGVLNLIHGDAKIAGSLVANSEIDGVLFTGSYRAGKSIHQTLAGHPEKMVALEMGGNNPLIVWGEYNTRAAIQLTIQSAYITSGQRCTCARRWIIPDGAQGDSLVQELAKALPKIKVGVPNANPQPFMGTLIHQAAARQMLDAQQELVNSGATIAVPMIQNAECGAMLTPGLIDLNGAQVADHELFGPLLLVQRARDFDHAVELANQTSFGLSAGLISDTPDLYQHFIHSIRAGVVNWNRQTTGASGQLPFGGVGNSGNHRPSGAFASDYCSYPVASLESPTAQVTPTPIVGLEDV